MESIYIDHSLSGKARRLSDHMDVKALISMLAIEAAMFLLVIYKGLGTSYWPTALFMMGLTVVVCAVAFYFEADKSIVFIILILLNIGFVVQQIQAGENATVSDSFTKMITAFAAAFIAAGAYQKLKHWIATPCSIAAMVLVQYAICLVMLVFGKVVGTLEQQGAQISISGLTPFEFVKVLYIFTAAGLLCKERMGGKGEIILMIHTVLLSVFFIICSELGTLMVIFVSGLIALILFGKRRKLIGCLGAASAAGFAGLWFVSVRILERGTEGLPGAVSKIIIRFGTALHPENHMLDSGYQGVQGLEAIAMGNWFGINSERYRMVLPEATNDFIFDNVIQTCGLLMGFIVLLFFFALMKKGMSIATSCSDGYFKVVAAIITIVITVQAIVHIGYNIAMFPITGLPLYFVSQGYTSLATGMMMITILLIISREYSNEGTVNSYEDNKYE